MKTSRIRLALLAGAALSIAAISQAKTVYVDASVPLSGDGTTPALAFQTIGEALVDGNTVAGDTILVAPGLYEEGDLSVSQWLIIQGAGSGSDPGTNTIVDGTTPATDFGFDILASGPSAEEPLVLRGLRVSNHAQRGVGLTGTHSNVTLEDVALVDNALQGVLLGDAAVVDNLRLLECVISGSGDGLRVEGDVDGLEIVGGNVDGNTVGLNVLQQIPPATTTQLTNVLIDGTTFNNNASKGLYIEKLENAVIRGIEVDSSGTSGALAAGIDLNLKYRNYANIQLLNITVNDCGSGDPTDGAGVVVRPRADAPNFSASPSLLNNILLEGGSITNCTTWGLRFGNMFSNAPSPTNAVVRYMTIADNGTSGGLRNETQRAIDARFNYWGTATGPETIIADSVYGFYFAGTGNPIEMGVAAVGTVRWAPFWRVVGGHDPVYVSPAHTGAVGSNPSGPGEFVGADAVLRIEDGLGSVSTGGTVNVAGGNYRESNLRLERPVTVTGAGVNDTVVVPAAEDSNVDSAFGGASVQNGFLLASADVTLENLSLDGSGNPTLTPGKRNYRAGITTGADSPAGLDNFTLRNVTVRNIYRRGITLISDASGYLLENVTIDTIELTSFLDGVGGGGFGLFYVDADGTIRDCTVTGADVSMVLAEAILDVEGNNVSGGRLGMWFTFSTYDPGEQWFEDPVIASVRGNSISASDTGVFTNATGDGFIFGGPDPADRNVVDVTPSGGDFGTGIRSQYTVGQLTLQNNQVIASGNDTAIWLYHIEDSANPVLVLDNELISSSPSATLFYEGTGIMLTDDGSVVGDEDGDVYAIVSGNTISGFLNGIALQRRGSAPAGGRNIVANIGGTEPQESNSISGCGSGILVFEIDAGANGGFKAVATIGGNVSTINGNDIGIHVEGGSASILNNAIYGNGVGVQVSAGGTVTAFANNNMDDPTDNASEPDGDADNVVDLRVAADAGPISIGSGNNFAADRSGNFYAGGPATPYYLENLSADTFDLSSGQLFDGVPVASLTLEELFAVEDLIRHAVDDPAAGFVRVRADNVYVTANSGSIQNAINAAVAGETVNIADGLYIASNTTVNKSLTLDGQSRDGVVIAPAGVDGKVDTTTTNSPQIGLFVMANDVTIRDLTIDGAANNTALAEPPGATNFRTGVLQDFTTLVHGTRIENCRVLSTYRRAIQLGTFTTALGRSTNNAVLDTIVDTVALRQAIAVSGDGVISGNTISNVGFVPLGPDYLGTGIYTEGIDSMITGNSIEDFSLAGIQNNPDRFAGPHVLVIRGNSISDPKDLQAGVYGMRLQGLDAGSVIGGTGTGQGNTIDLVSADNTLARVGVLLRNASDNSNGAVTVSGNDVTVAGEGSAVWLYGNVNGSGVPELDQNTLTAAPNSTSGGTGAGTGVYLFDEGALIGTTDSGQSALLTGNTFSGFTAGVFVESTTNRSLNLTVGGNAVGDNNTIAGCDVGILLLDADGISGTATLNASIVNNAASIHGSGSVGIEVSGAHADIVGNRIYDNPVGIRILDTGTALIEANDFVGSPRNLVDLKTEADAGDISVSPNVANDFAGTTFFIEHLSPQDFDGTLNRFEVASGLRYPGAMTAAEQVDLQDRVYHQPDNASSGLIFFDFSLKPETWVNDDWVGLPNGSNVTVPGGGTEQIGDAAFETIALAYPRTLQNGRINVLDGVYAEPNTVLAKPITVAGQSRNGARIVPAAEDDQQDNLFGGVVQNGFVIASNRVTIEDLTIDGQGNTSLTAGRNNMRHGIVTAQGSPPGLDDVTLQRLNIRNIYRRGMHITTQAEGWLIDDVLVDTVEDTSFIDGFGGGGVGIFLVDADGTISNSEVIRSDIGMLLAHSEVDLTGNTVSRGRRGIWLTPAGYDAPEADDSLKQLVGGLAFSLTFDPAEIQPTGIAENVTGSPIQFEQLLTSSPSAGRLNFIGGITDPANSSFSGHLFQIELQNQGVALTSSDGSGVPDGLILDDNSDVTPPHLQELSDDVIAIDHTFARILNPDAVDDAVVVYTVIGDALTPGSTFILRATLVNPNAFTLESPLNQLVGGFAFSFDFDPSEVQPVGIAANVTGSPIQFEQLLTSTPAADRVNLIGAITDPANSDFTGDMFDIQFQNQGVPLTSSDGSGLPDSLILGPNPDVTPPHLLELSDEVIGIPHTYARVLGAGPLNQVVVVYTVIGDALTPGSTFTVRVSLVSPISNPILARLRGNVVSASQVAILTNNAGDGTIIGGPDPADRNIVSLLLSGPSFATGIRSQFSLGQLTIQNNEFILDDNDTGIWLFRNENAGQPLLVVDNEIESANSAASSIAEANGIFVTDDGSLIGENDGPNYALIQGNTISGMVHGILVHRSGSGSPGGHLLDVTIGGNEGRDRNFIHDNGTGIRAVDVDGAGAGGPRAVVEINGNAPIFGNALAGIHADGSEMYISRSVIRNNLNVGLHVENEAQVSIIDSTFFNNLSFSIESENTNATPVQTTNVYWGASDGPAPVGAGFPILGPVNFTSVAHFGGLYNEPVPASGGTFQIPAAFNDRYTRHAVTLPALDGEGTLRLYGAPNRFGVDNSVEVVLEGANMLSDATLTVEYDPLTDLDVSEIEDDMKLHRRVGASWVVDLSSTADPFNNTVSGSVSSFSTFSAINVPGTMLEDWHIYH